MSENTSRDDVFRRFDLVDASSSGSEPIRGWMCNKCQFVLGGAALPKAPAACPMCAIASGEVVALMPSGQALPKMLTFDRGFADLVEQYRLAKRDARRESMQHQALEQAGNYDLDGDVFSADAEASSSREFRSAMALADATLERAPRRDSRTSAPSRRPSRTSPPARGSARRNS